MTKAPSAPASRGPLLPPPYRNALIAAIAAGAVVRIAVALFLAAKGYNYPDEDTYWQLGEHLRSGQGLTLAQDALGGTIRAGEPTAFFGFFFNALVAGLQVLCGGHRLAARLLLGQLSWLATVLGVLGLGRGSLTPLERLVAVAGLALYPNLHFIAAFLMTEVVMTPGILLALWASRELASRRAAITMGVTYGLVHLTKATFLALEPLHLAWLAWRGDRSTRRNAAIAAGVTALVLAPWVARNYSAYHRITLETKSGYNLWFFNNPWHTKPVLHEDFKAVCDLPDYPPSANEPERSDLCRERFVAFLREHPFVVARLCVSRFLNVWSTAPLYMSIPAPVAVVVRIANLALYALLVWGAVLSVRRGVNAEALTAIVYLTAILSLTAASFRQRSYIDPCIFMVASLPVAALIERLRGADR